jgi:hypothetical protein
MKRCFSLLSIQTITHKDVTFILVLDQKAVLWKLMFAILIWEAKKSEGRLWTRTAKRHPNQALSTSRPLLGPPCPGTALEARWHSPSVTALPLGTLPKSTVGPSRKIVSSPPETTLPLFSVCRFRVSCVFSTVGHKCNMNRLSQIHPKLQFCMLEAPVTPTLASLAVLSWIFKSVLWHGKKSEKESV